MLNELVNSLLHTNIQLVSQRRQVCLSSDFEYMSDYRQFPLMVVCSCVQIPDSFRKFKEKRVSQNPAASEAKV